MLLETIDLVLCQVKLFTFLIHNDFLEYLSWRIFCARKSFLILEQGESPKNQRGKEELIFFCRDENRTPITRVERKVFNH